MSFPDSGFVGDDLVPREIEFPDGKKHTIHFKKAEYADIRRWQLAETSDDEARKLTNNQKLVAQMLREPDGSKMLTFEQATKISPMLLNRLVLIILEVSGVTTKSEEEKNE